MRRVLSVTSECAPLVKTGGLADVAGALPAALAGQGWDMRTILPGYPSVLSALDDAGEVAAEADLYGGPASLRAGRAGGLSVYVLDAPHLYDRAGGPYLDPDGADWPDNPERFAALCRMAARLARDGDGDWTPEVVQGHDWQAGLAPYYLRGSGVPTVQTIHNVAFHGLAPRDRAAALGLDPDDDHMDGYEFWGRISALKAGLVWADRLTTVSPTYARELTTPAYGAGMEGVLSARAGDLTGILNGIDTDVWSPAADGADDKDAARDALRAEMALPPSTGPLAVVVSRLSEQKGLDLLLDALPEFLEAGGQLALLGSGDPALERAWRAAGDRHPGVAVTIGYDEGLAHRLIAGGDCILVPSRFEPCGLTQMMGLRYGTLPVVALTGGLADTVIPANPMALRSGVATGFQFHPVTRDALAAMLLRVLELYRERPIWTQMQRNAMRQDVGWSAAAAVYARLFASLAGGTDDGTE